MRVAIISINKYSKHLNYGAALHSYAFQQTLDLLGVDNLIIDYLPKFMENYHLKYPILDAIKSRKIKRVFSSASNMLPNLIKYNKFQKFFLSNYRTSEEILTINTLVQNGILKKYNFTEFMCVSDVIWSPESTLGFDRGYFLDFPDAENCKRISYAPSIGHLNFSENECVEFKKFVKKFDYISLREKSGKNYVEHLTNTKVVNVLDPTLLLDKFSYEKILSETDERGYVLIYNCLHNDKDMVRAADIFAKEKGLKVIEISCFPLNLKYHQVKLSAGIEEFLGLFKHAEYVFTNAFHGTCFSIIFQKEFFTFARSDKDSRMLDLLALLDLSNHFISNSDKKKKLPYLKIDYERVYKLLKLEQEKSVNFIKNSLNID